MRKLCKNCRHWMIRKLGGHVGPVVSNVHVLAVNGGDQSVESLIYSSADNLFLVQQYRGGGYVWQSDAFGYRFPHGAANRPIYYRVQLEYKP